MLSSRIVIYGQDEAEVRPWVGAVAATGGTVDVVTDISAVDPRSDLVVAAIPTPPEPLFQKLGELQGRSSAVVVQPAADLLTSVKALRNPAVHAVLVKDYVNQALLTSVSARLLRGNIFGVSKTMSWGVRVYTEIVGSHDDRLQALGTLSRFTSGMKLRAKYREAIDVVADELLMNGLYDAPTDAHGQAVFGDVAPGERTGVRLERPAVLQFASDGARLVLAVRDSFGSLRRDSVLANLERCAQSAEQIDRKTAGAGLGLYLVANHVSEMIFNILPGVATEVACVIDLKAPRQQLRHIGFYEESVQGAEHSGAEGGGQLRTMPSAAVASNRAVYLTLFVAVLLLAVAGVLMVWPYVYKPARAQLRVTTDPSGAVIRVNGIRKGVSSPSLTIGDLEPDSPTAVSATLEGFGEVQEVVKLKANQTFDFSLALKKLRAKVRVSSSPQGAQVFVDGKDTGQKTPTVLDDLEPEKELDIELKMHGFAPSAGTVKALAAQMIIYHAKLSTAPGFAVIALTSTPPGARVLVNDVDTGEVTPLPGFVVRGKQRYSIKLVREGRFPWTYEWTAKDGDRLVKSVVLPEAGRLSLTVNSPGVAVIGDQEHRLPLKDQLVPAGALNVILKGKALDTALKLNVNPGERVTRRLVFGFVKVEPKEWRIKISGGRLVNKLALRPGPQEVTVVDRNGDALTAEVVVKPKVTVTVDAAKLGGGGGGPKKKGAKKGARPPRSDPATKPPKPETPVKPETPAKADKPAAKGDKPAAAPAAPPTKKKAPPSKKGAKP